MFAGGASSIQGIVLGPTDSIEQTHSKAQWRWVAIGVAIVIAIIFFLFTDWPETADALRTPQPYLGEFANWKYGALIVVTTTPGWMLGFYMIAMLVIRGIITFIGLRKVFHAAEVNVQPLHPDKCGGLTDLRDYALRLSYMIAAFGLGIAGWLYVTSRSLDPCVMHLPDEGMIRIESDCINKVNDDQISETLKGLRTQLVALGMLSKTESGDFILADGGKVILQEEGKINLVRRVWLHEFAPLKTDVVTSVEKAPVLGLGVVAYVVFAPLIFFGTLGTAHGPMKAKKKAYLEQLSANFNDEYEAVHEKEVRGKGDDDRFQRLKRLRELHEMAEAFPVWPWDPGSIRRFIAAVSSPLVIVFVTVAIQALVRG